MYYRYVCFVLILLFTTFIHTAAKTTIAVNEFKAQGVSTDEAAIITNRLRSEFIKTGKFTVVERGQMESILKEQGFQQSGCASDECIVEVGQLLGVSTMIAGSIGKIGTMFTINVRVIDVATGKILTTVDSDCKCKIEELLTKTTKDIAQGLAKNMKSSGQVEKKEEAEEEQNAGTPANDEEQKVGEGSSPETSEDKQEKRRETKLYKNGFLISTKYEFRDADLYLSIDYIRLFNERIGISVGGGFGFVQTEVEFFGGLVINSKPVIIGLNMGWDTYSGLMIRTPIFFKIKRSGILLDVAFEPMGEDGLDVKLGLGAGFFF